MLHKQHSNRSKNLRKKFEAEYTFKIILKFWKKSSIHDDVTLKESQCISISEFVNSIKEKYSIKSAHCLEEIWIIQLGKEYDREIPWIKQIHGRVKLDVPQKYKDFLIQLANETGERSFEDSKF